MSSTQHTAVIVVGGGATGLFTAILLAQAGVSVVVLEVQTIHADIPRVISYMPQLEVEFRRAGLWDQLAEAAGNMSATGITFRSTSDTEKSAIYQVPHKPGAAGTLLLPQWKWIDVAVKRLRSLPHARLLMGHHLRGFDAPDPGEGPISVQVESWNGERQIHNFTCDYLIGADGGRSTVRKLSGIHFEGETLPQQLVATDMYYPGFEQAGWTGANFMVGPKHFGICSPIDSEGLWRVSFGVPEGSDITESIPMWYNNMLPLRERADCPKYTIANVGTYRAQQLCASAFCKDRVALVGDAAHLTNPYMGLGLASGFYDGASLADVLVKLLHGDATLSLLSEWAAARKEVYHKYVDPLSRAAFAAVQSSDVNTLKAQHPMIKMVEAVKAGKMKPGPLHLGTDVVRLQGLIDAR
ncbi:FAD/NAD(P)-binding domain-containing protein [Polychaeton citri CBS 116435]|uniref:FAD/NAD(P)-binding domain-containing protein n=1 Tax=Polychaeton citri CBS 116435 TaxID=1314669 RepID=A0A9P4UVK7_9PEZI|nr:FAD/NAD(P)-binding domain-containing protein [Polychaeton citri CBS 116435]